MIFFSSCPHSFSDKTGKASGVKKLAGILNTLFGKKNRGPSSNPDFIRLVQIMKADSEFRKFVMKVLKLPKFEKQSLLNTKVEELKLKQVPPEHIHIFECLNDQEICDEIESLLKKEWR